MENVYSQIDVNAYVAKYMDEMGCNLSQACEELGIDPSDAVSYTHLDVYKRQLYR